MLKIEIYWSRKEFFDDRCAALESPSYVMLYLAFYKLTEELNVIIEYERK